MAHTDEIQLLKAALAEREEQALEKERQLERYAADLRETFKQERAAAMQLQASYRATVRALANAVEARDAYTGRHAQRVAAYGLRIGHAAGVEVDAQVEFGFLLHDVGKVAVPDHILTKPGPLEEHERRLIEEHTVIGAKIVRSIAGLAHLAPAIRAGHERWDGRGYPDGLAGEEIPIISRVTFACDAFDAMTSDRPYRKSLGVDCARRELEANVDSQFCSTTVHALMSVIDQQAA